MQPIWRIHPTDPSRAQRLGEALAIHPHTAQLLLNRGVTDHTAAGRFLHPGLHALEDPRSFPGIERALSRLRRAVAEQEPIMIFGDSDVDGLTASVILYEALQEAGAVVRATQSNRIADGYGLPPRVVQQLLRSSTRLLILVDCGTNQADEVEELTRLGIDVVIVDHHVPIGRWAKPAAMVNPHCASGRGQGLCSAGLAFKLAQGLLGPAAEERWEAYLDLAALGTLADCSPVLGENRVMISAGLERIVHSHRRGLARLCEATQTLKPDPEQIVRRLIPRLNASGRLGDSTAIWKLLLSEEAGLFDDWMARAETAHATTKQLHRRLIGEAREQVNRLHFKDQFVIVVSRVGWPQGLMGPLASQLANQHGRPAIAIALGERHGVGSGRSIPLFDLLEALQACQHVLMRFGGHAQACGFMVDRNHLEPFQTLVNEQAQRSIGRAGLQQVRIIDLELPLDAVTSSWAAEVERLAPFGRGNPRPTVALRHLRLEVKSARRAVLSDGSVGIEARGTFPIPVDGERYDVVASPMLAEGELVLTVCDVRVSAEPWEPARTSGTSYRRGPA
ncbi:MAG: DHH family phosphoesterase [Candidatus Omnitrophica bacterium]|nr:DHH family phosphoesterase [Candidatus Omnitrophota bacterium]